MMVWLRHVLGWLGSAFCAREDLIPRKSCVASAVARSSSPAPSPATHCVTQAVLVVLRKLWDKWKEPLILATPRTVVDWHRAGFRLYWKWLSRAKSRGGRKPVRDRKSTRLNSSHLGISYAVFCLKKKK